MFGVKVEDFQPVNEPFRLTPMDKQAGDTMRLSVALCGAEVMTRDTAGQVVATRHRHGKGTAIFFGTALTLGYHRHPDPQAGEWIAAPARPHARAMSVSATTRAPRLFFRSMSYPDGLAAILSNPGAACRARVAFRGAAEDIEDVLSGRRFKAAARNGASEVEVNVPAGGVVMLRAEARR